MVDQVVRGGITLAMCIRAQRSIGTAAHRCSVSYQKSWRYNRGGTAHAASVRWPSIDLNEQGYLVDMHRTAFGACGWWTGGMRVWFKDRPVK